MPEVSDIRNRRIPLQKDAIVNHATAAKNYDAEVLRHNNRASLLNAKAKDTEDSRREHMQREKGRKEKHRLVEQCEAASNMTFASFVTVKAPEIVEILNRMNTCMHMRLRDPTQPQTPPTQDEIMRANLFLDHLRVDGETLDTLVTALNRRITKIIKNGGRYKQRTRRTGTPQGLLVLGMAAATARAASMGAAAATTNAAAGAGAAARGGP